MEEPINPRKRFIKRAILTIAGVWLLFHYVTSRPIRIASGPTYVAGPIQKETFDEPWKTTTGETVIPLASYKIQAILLSKEAYASWFDNAGGISKWDLALAWGPAANKEVIEAIAPEQYGRWVKWKVPLENPAIKNLKDPDNPEKTVFKILEHSLANVHVICDEPTAKALGKLRKYQTVTLTGNLIEVHFPKGARPWRSSLSREDSGAHACEIMHVKSFTTP